jgi:8-oxo-dGTP diphosphatase
MSGMTALLLFIVNLVSHMPKSDQGSLQQSYKVVPRTLVFIFRGDEVLLIKGAPTKRLWANLYNGIGGHIERGEDVLNSARRELIEETGLTHEGLIFCGSVIIDVSPEVGVGIYVFYGDWAGGKINESVEGRLQWCKVQDLTQIACVSDLPELVQHVLAAKESKTCFFAFYSYDEDNQLVIKFVD